MVTSSFSCFNLFGAGTRTSLAVEAEAEDAVLVAGNETRRGDGVGATSGTLGDCLRSWSFPSLRLWVDIGSGFVAGPLAGGNAGVVVAGVGLGESSAYTRPIVSFADALPCWFAETSARFCKSRIFRIGTPFQAGSSLR
ncbi:hypothetical protein BOTBODRAFT_508709 [Botryobasidium botryosum FD-172 SS1]|uniref:Uncharacterized protein n=1 Tax=Botryobasidium botryosum (strain FD-172 SS1) TaxID=930990 RepID=A0A067MRD8_BOTB1|nr:hypothetical protein BOTBODRAFT_508709 [Botryobasidium botryosum FD-172 SS1]